MILGKAMYYANFLFLLYSPEGLRKRASRVGAAGPYGKLLLELAQKVESKEMSGYEAMEFLHGWQRKHGIR